MLLLYITMPYDITDDFGFKNELMDALKLNFKTHNLFKDEDIYFTYANDNWRRSKEIDKSDGFIFIENWNRFKECIRDLNQAESEGMLLFRARFTRMPNKHLYVVKGEIKNEDYRKPDPYSY